MKIMSVVGARPNFMKIAPLIRELSKYPDQFEHLLVHTGQHYDARMNQAFFEALEIPAPDVNLEVGSGSHAEQVGRTMICFERVVRDWRPDWIVVVGDVNATCACAITAKKEHVKLAHIEAGLRSFDLDMPEEINRMVTDRLADVLFTTDGMASDNLRKEGVPQSRIQLVGNIMIDTLLRNRERAAELDLNQVVRENLLDCGGAPGGSKPLPKLSAHDYAIVTLHRPSNVDDRGIFGSLLEFILTDCCRDMAVVWPLHPRTRKQMQVFGLWEKACATPGLLMLEPLGYHELLRLNMQARLMFTDSGGLQEECCVLGTPCLTLRDNTERPVTLEDFGGASVLVGHDIDQIRCQYNRRKNGQRVPCCPPLWDGRVAERIVAFFRDECGMGA